MSEKEGVEVKERKKSEKEKEEERVKTERYDGGIEEL